jgi:hypothetical protein
MSKEEDMEVLPQRRSSWEEDEEPSRREEVPPHTGVEEQRLGGGPYDCPTLPSTGPGLHTLSLPGTPAILLANR